MWWRLYGYTKLREGQEKSDMSHFGGELSASRREGAAATTSNTVVGGNN